MPLLASLIPCGEQPNRNCNCSFDSPQELTPIKILSGIEDERPQQEGDRKLDEKQQPMNPRCEMAVVGKEDELKGQYVVDRRERQRGPSHRPKKPAQPALSLARRAGENLREQGIGKSLPHQRIFGGSADRFVDD